MKPEALLPWLCLKSAPEIGFKTSLRLIESFGDPSTFVGKPEAEIYTSGSISQKASEHLKAFVLPKNTGQIIKTSQAYGIEFVPITDPMYPTALKQTFSPPLVLYYRGELSRCSAAPILAVVGTRKPSAYGRESTRKLLTPLCERGISIISGLAMGIDTIAHQCALEKNSGTIAVLAHGLDEVYPPLNRELAKRIVQNGLLLSEYEPCTKVEKWNFPARNRIISALSNAVFIIEGALTSGAMLTAKFALEQSREILALPGNINSFNAGGPNYLIKCGARVITCPEDLLQVFDLEPEKGGQMDIFPDLSDNEQKVLELVRGAAGEISFDEIMLKSKLGFGELSIALLNLELKSVIAKAGGNSFILC